MVKTFKEVPTPEMFPYAMFSQLVKSLVDNSLQIKNK